MKTKEELNALKKEVESLNKKLAELTDEELEQVSGGMFLNNGSRTCRGEETKNVLFTEQMEASAVAESLLFDAAKTDRLG